MWPGAAGPGSTANRNVPDRAPIIPGTPDNGQLGEQWLCRSVDSVVGGEIQ
jgi:hypothetical protein